MPKAIAKGAVGHEQTQQPPPLSQAPAIPQSPAQQPAQPVPAAPTPTPQTAPVHSGPVIVLNPAHGGTDSGARGGTGAIEKDIVLQYARAVRAELERNNFRAVLTREDDSNPSYDDRAAMTNTYRNVIFVSLHIASTGAAGTARVYYYRFASVPSGPVAADATTTVTTTTVAAGATAGSAPTTSLVDWEQAQRPHVEASHRLADALQSELAQRFSGSPIMPTAAAVRELRSINAPAVAVEVSSVTVPDANTLTALASPLAAAIAHGIEVFRSSNSAGSN
jgi:N-acetylmuramoyl-L-alanine amidase